MIDKNVTSLACFPVFHKMLNYPHRFVIFFYNLLGTLSLKYEAGNYEVSKISVILNSIKISLSILVLTVIFASKFLKDIYKGWVVNLNSLSVFSQVMLIVLVFFINFVSLAISVLQTIRLKIIRDFMNDAGAIYASLNKASAQSFHKIIKTNILVIILLCTIASIVQLSVFELSYKTVLIFIPVMYPGFLNLGLLGFIKSCEGLFAISLKNFKAKLEESLKKASFESGDWQELAILYRNLYELNLKFNITFGTQMTIITCCSAVTTTLDVIMTFSYQYMIRQDILKT